MEEIYIVKQEDAPAGPNSNPLAAGGASGSSNQPLLLYENEDIEIKDEPLSVHGSDDEEYEDEKYEPPTPFLHAIPLEVKLVEDLPKKLEAAAIKKEPVDIVAAAAAAAVALTEVQPQRPKATSAEKTDSKDSVELTLREKVKKEEDVSSDDDWGDDDCEPLAKQVRQY